MEEISEECVKENILNTGSLITRTMEQFYVETGCSCVETAEGRLRERERDRTEGQGKQAE